MPRSVLVELPAEASNVQILRVVTMSVAGGEAPIDSVSDAGLAVDEAAALLLEVPGTSRLSARINSGPHGVELVLHGDASSDAWPPDGFEASLASDVLNALAHRVEFQSAGGAGILLEL
ncbi:MAG: hypothetical protein HKN74_02195 [Acidimicrobiia bacterium]|nr:hypothetical protein [Acidimicrobiia bacterium]MBT8216967.1 hypothetical protein [Acidimicrobiia bacterium]NNF09072.1 hypothetical protein [Acidimicrobiia bacterium]NNL71282.1 hypothetical protein [Acidimicrobiia bacterium]